MLRIRPAVRLACFQQPLRKALATATACGAEAVELDVLHELPLAEMSKTAIRQVRKLLEDHRLKVSALSFPTRRGYHIQENLDRRVEATKQALQLAADLGSQVVTNRIGVVPADTEAPDFVSLKQVLTDLGHFGQRVGAILAARSGGEDGAVLATLMQTLPAGCAAVDLDPGSLLMNGYSATESTSVLADFIVHMRVRDGLRDVSRGRGEETVFGSGAVDFNQLFAILEEHHYHGFFTVEREYSSYSTREIENTVKQLRSI